MSIKIWFSLLRCSFVLLLKGRWLFPMCFWVKIDAQAGEVETGYMTRCLLLKPCTSHDST